MFERIRDYIGSSSGTAGADLKGQEAVPDEELREDLNLTAKPKGTTSFNGKNVMVALAVLGALFTGCFVYGIATASNHQKDKQAQTEVETAADGQQNHLKNAPGSYDDSKAKRYEHEKQQEDKDNKRTRQHQQSDDSEYERARRTPSYTPVPQSSYRMTTPRPNLPANTTARQPVQHGMTDAQKIQAAKAKEKMEANQSPIGFKLSEDMAAKEEAKIAK